jgi:hypothetical protein
MRQNALLQGFLQGAFPTRRRKKHLHARFLTLHDTTPQGPFFPPPITGMLYQMLEI